MRAAQPAACGCTRAPGGGRVRHVSCAATPSGPPAQRPRPRQKADGPALDMPTPVLDAGRPVSAAQQLRFERRGHVCTRGLFTPQEVQLFVPRLTAALEKERLAAFKQRVQVLCPPEVAERAAGLTTVAALQQLLRDHAQDAVGFLQVFNLHRRVESPEGDAARALVTCPRLGAVAAALLGVPRVRVYQSCLFVKEPGMGDTNWHSDLNMVPLDTNAFLTAWLPLRSLSQADSALTFASGSHRDFALPYWHTDDSMNAGLERRGYGVEAYYPPLALGDVTWHHGWTLHSAPGQPQDGAPRVALAVSFFADGARRLPGAKHLRRVPHSEDAAGCADWLGDVQPGALARHAALPLVFGEQ